MRVHFASPIDPAAIERLSERFLVTTSRDQAGLDAAIVDADILGFRSGVEVQRAGLDSAQNLGLLIRAGSGLDNVDVDTVRRRGMRLARVPGPGAQAVAELTMGVIFSLARHIAHADRTMRAGEWRKHDLAGRLVSTQTLGIVGVGSIGSRVAGLAGAIGMRVIGCTKNGRTSVPGVEYMPMHEVIAEADIVSVHTPLVDETRHLVDADFLARMKPGSVIVNTSRGGVLDETALANALASGHIAAAGLDVHASEGGGVPLLAKFENVVLTPHIGAMARDSQAQIGHRFIELVEAFLEGALDDVATPEELVV